MSIISCTYFFSNLKSGIPYFKIPPNSFSFSNTVTRNPFLLNSYAHSKPAGPDPITAIFSFLSSLFIIGISIFLFSAHSLTNFSKFPICVGVCFIPLTHDPSH